MSIEVATLISTKAKKYGASESAPDFIQLIIDGVNSVLADIDLRLHTSNTAIRSQDDVVPETVSEVLTLSVINLGLDYYVGALNPQWTTESYRDVQSRYIRQLELLCSRYRDTDRANDNFKGRFGNIDTVAS